MRYLTFTLLAFGLNALLSAQADLPPPPPGVISPGQANRPKEAARPLVEYEENVIILNDLVGDVNANTQSYPPIDIRQVRLEKIRGRFYRLTFIFEEDLPTIPEEKYCGVRIYLDLDRDSESGRASNGLGYERMIGFYDSGSGRGWRPSQSMQSDNRLKNIEIGETEVLERSLSVEFEIPRASEFDHFELRGEVFYSGYIVDEIKNVVVGFDME